jgi:hypothetical protein
MVMHEIATCPDAGKYACQEKAWMDEPKMHAWIDVVLKLWKEARDANNPSTEPPTLYLMRTTYTRWDLLSMKCSS